MKAVAVARRGSVKVTSLGVRSTPLGPVTQYQDCWLAYLDILGFGDMVAEAERAGRSAATITAITDCLRSVLMEGRRSFRPHSRLVGRALSVRVFSDLVLLWEPAHEPVSLLRMLADVPALVLEFHLRGFLLRGALVKGKHHDDGTVVYSPALIEAHELERTKACSPRVLVSEAVVDALHATLKDLPPCSDLAAPLWEEGGQRFLSYLHAATTHGTGEPDMAVLARHREVIQAKLAEYGERGDVWGKCAWLARYHNRFCREVLGPERAVDLLINLPE
jgi:hypothetical protein